MRKIVSRQRTSTPGTSASRSVEVLVTDTEAHDTAMSVQLAESDCTNIDDWVTERKIGRRISFNMWNLNSLDDVTLFLLTWN